MRHPHVLKPTTRPPAWKATVFFATESHTVRVSSTDSISHLKRGLLCIVPTDGTSAIWREFTDGEQFVACLEEQANRYQHLLCLSSQLFADCMLLQLCAQLPRNMWTLRYVYLGMPERAFTLRVKRDRQTITFCDSRGYFLTSYDEMHEHVRSSDQDAWLDEHADLTASDPLRQQVAVLRSAVLGLWALVERERLGPIRTTIAGQAFNAYRSRFMRHRIYIHDHDLAVKVEQAANHGSRTEIFHYGHVAGAVHHLDVNSMYPSLMYHKLFPHNLIRVYERSILPQGIQELRERCWLLGEVTLNTGRPRFPVRQDGRVTWPIGRFTTVLGHTALLDALDHGEIEEYHTLCVYQHAPLFREYVEFFWRLRQDARARGDNFGQLLAKRFLNTLWGKFGQHAWRMVDCGPCDPAAFSATPCTGSDRRDLLVEMMGRSLTLIHSDEFAYDAFPAITAAMIDYAHTTMWQLLQRAGMQNVLYIDTDSLFVNEAGYDHLRPLLGSGLGQLKEVACDSDLVLRGIRNYSHAGRHVIAGIPQSARERLTDSEINYTVSDGPRSALLNKHADTVHHRLVRARLRKQ